MDFFRSQGNQGSSFATGTPTHTSDSVKSPGSTHVSLSILGQSNLHPVHFIK